LTPISPPRGVRGPDFFLVGPNGAYIDGEGQGEFSKKRIAIIRRFLQRQLRSVAIAIGGLKLRSSPGDK